MFTPILLAAALSSSGLSYAQARARADYDEASLKPPQHAALVASQGLALKSAIGACVAALQPATLPDFTVVLMLGRNGMARRSWLHVDTPFTRCVQDKLAASTLFAPPRAPFYTSFEFTFTQ